MAHRLSTLSLLAAGCLAVGAPVAQTASPSYADFSDASSLHINAGAATVATGGTQVLRVAPSDQNQRGSAFTDSPIALTDESSFSTAFSFRFSDQGDWAYNGETGGDGLVFVVQTVSNSAGSEGGGIGYDGISNSVGIEFDSWHNEQDPDRSHVGINIGGSVRSVATRSTLSPGQGMATLGDLDDGQVWYAWVDYNGAADQLEVRVAKTDSRPAAPFLSHTVDLLGELGSNADGSPKPAYVGFTSATGMASADHDVLSWSFENEYDPIESVPAPGPAPGPTASACSSIPALPGSNAWGDVHLRTPDGLTYDFQAAGEFVLVQSEDGSVVVQTRQVEWDRNPRVTVNKAAAMNVAGDRIGVYIDGGDPLVVNGEPMTLGDDPMDLPNGGCLVKGGSGANPVYHVVWPNGFTAAVYVFGSGHLDVGVARGSSDGSYAGLVGTLDGNAQNDLTTRTGQVIASPASFSALYEQFGASWRVTSSESLFWYASGTSTASVNAAALPERPFTVNDLSEEDRSRARTACAGIDNPVVLEDCVLDVGATGDVTFATSATAVAQAVATSGQTMIEMDPVIETEFGSVYKLKTIFRGGSECLEGNQASSDMHGGAAFMDDCDTVTGQSWRMVPAGEGTYRLQTLFRGEAECLESNGPDSPVHGGAAFMDRCQDVTGQKWRLVNVRGPQYRLQSELHGDAMCLEGNEAGSDVHQGAAFMSPCSDASGQIWRVREVTLD